jgi:hypothetical protein
LRAMHEVSRARESGFAERRRLDYAKVRGD